MGRLDDKVAVITGAGSGVGRACMELFAREGAKVVGAGRTQRTLDESLAVVVDAGGTGTVVPTDVSKEADCRALIEATVKAYGRIDILVNNAGVGWDYRESHEHGMDPLAETPTEFWEEVININLNSVYYVSKYVIPLMRDQGGGAIVNVSSIGGIRAMEDAHAYSAAKAGMNNLTRSMAKTYGPQSIRTNCIAPGLIETSMIRSYMAERGDPQLQDASRYVMCPLGRPSQPMEIAAACLFMASDEASYVNGTVLPVDGGTSA